jgi:hypothetical protein
MSLSPAYHDVRRIGNHNAIGKKCRIRHFGSAETTVNHVKFWKRFLQVPHSNAGTAYKEVGVFGWRRLRVFSLEGRNRDFPPRGRGGLLGKRKECRA